MKPSKKTSYALCKTTAEIVAVLAGGLFFSSCNLAPEYAKPSASTPNGFKEMTPAQSRETDGWKSAEPRDDLLRGPWWELFHEPELNALEQQVADGNQDVAAARASFLAARAIVKQARSQYFPTVTASPSVTRARQASPFTQAGAAPTASTYATYTLPFDATWEVDFWDRTRNAVKASTLEAQASLADLASVRLTVQAEVAVDYFQLRALDAQKVLLEATAVGYQESLRLIRVQQDTGLASDQDIAQAETLLAVTRAQATDLGIQRAQLEHALATLLGQPASTFALPVNALTTEPVAVPFGVPSQLLERRPDIAAAERRVAAANAQIGVARAAYFPALILGGSGGYESRVLGDLFSQPGLVWSVGATLAQTIFDAGKSKAVTEQARAVYQGTVANYRQTVLSAFQEAEDNLSALRLLSQELQQQNAAVESSQRYLKLAEARYQSGLDSYLNVIVAQTTLSINQRTALNLRMEQMTASVQLIKALGGGWTVAPAR